MGHAKVPLRAPQDFLKKHENEPVVEERKTFKYEDSDHRKPPVPKPTDAPIMGITTNKNFIKQNAMDAILQVPKKPVRQVVDARNGDKQLLEPSGLEPVYIHKKVSLVFATVVMLGVECMQMWYNIVHRN